MDNQIMQDKSYGRNQLLDIFRLIAAVNVCLIHFGFKGRFGLIVNAITRFAVPFFFIISGYYSYGKPEKNKYKIFNLIKLALLNELLSFLFYYQKFSLSLVSRYISIKSLVCLGLGFYGSSGVGWFIYSLILCYVVDLFCGKSKKQKAKGNCLFICFYIHSNPSYS